MVHCSFFPLTVKWTHSSSCYALPVPLTGKGCEALMITYVWLIANQSTLGVWLQLHYPYLNTVDWWNGKGSWLGPLLIWYVCNLWEVRSNPLLLLSKGRNVNVIMFTLVVPVPHKLYGRGYIKCLHHLFSWDTSFQPDLAPWFLSSHAT